jgi:hypothetical protein
MTEAASSSNQMTISNSIAALKPAAFGGRKSRRSAKKSKSQKKSKSEKKGRSMKKRKGGKSSKH